MDNPIRLHWLDPRDPDQHFPPSHLAMRDPNGLLAIGGDLSITRMLRAYSQGIFPWYNPDEPILWWCPDPRAVLQPDQMKVSRSLGKSIARKDYAITFDRVFSDVLDACAGARAKSRGTWLGSDMQQAYCDLHEQGHSHSIEIWRKGQLIGGLYGVSVGRVFFGESMFSRANDASKIALYYLCEQLKQWSYELIDCQISSAHLASLGAQEISRGAFLELLAPAVQRSGRSGRWQFDIDVPASAEHLP
ncbi:MAG: leucyl/phenylalanyl-tRNA--protein transferase [Pseudomonadota bacterium]